MAPSELPILPSGEVNVHPPAGETAWAECLRDLKRTLEGGSVFIVGRWRRYPLRDPSKATGDISREACDEAFDELSRAIGFELLAQAAADHSAKRSPPSGAEAACKREGCVRPAGHEGPCVDGQLQELAEVEAASPENPSQVEKEKLHELARRVAANISVAPGMQAVLAHNLPPALWQPTFVVCIGSGQVRVVTLAFVGEPVAGDRPSCKRTPYMLRVVTADLAAPPAGEHIPAKYAVRFSAEGLTSTQAHLGRMEPGLFAAASEGRWRGLEEMGTFARTAPGDPRSAKARTLSSAGDKVDEAPRQQIGDRAARIRASFERAQSPAAATFGTRQPPTPASRGRPHSTALAQGVSENRAPRTQASFEKPAAGVSVLADGFSVRSVAGAWNSMTSTASGGGGFSLGGLFGRARSPVAPAAPAPRPMSVPSGAAVAGRGPMAVDRQARMRASMAQANGGYPAAAGKPVVVDRAARMRANFQIQAGAGAPPASGGSGDARDQLGGSAPAITVGGS